MPARHRVEVSSINPPARDERERARWSCTTACRGHGARSRQQRPLRTSATAPSGQAPARRHGRLRAAFSAASLPTEEPSLVPRALAAARPAMVRWLIMRRSCSASAA